jgi:hypothetical protein
LAHAVVDRRSDGVGEPPDPHHDADVVAAGDTFGRRHGRDTALAREPFGEGIAEELVRTACFASANGGDPVCTDSGHHREISGRTSGPAEETRRAPPYPR